MATIPILADIDLRNNNITQANTLYVGDGSSGSPSITFTNDTDTGIYRDGVDTITFATAGQERLSLGADGSLSLGYPSMTSGNPYFYFYGYKTSAGAAKYGRFRIDGGGTFVIEAQDNYLTFSANAAVVINPHLWCWNRIEMRANNKPLKCADTGGTTRSVFGINNLNEVVVGAWDIGWTDVLVLKTAGQTRVYIENTGFIGVNKTTPNYQLDVEGDVGVSGNRVREVGTPLLGTDAANKEYVDGRRLPDAWNRGTLFFYDDFLTVPWATWATASGGSGSGIYDGGSSWDGLDANHPGIAGIGAGSDPGGYAVLYSATQSLQAGHDLVFEALLQVRWSDNTGATVRVGIGDDTSGADHVDGIYFEYDQSVSGNWRICTSASGVQTKSTTTVAVTNGSWVRLKWVVDNIGSSVEFFINGSSVGIIPSNLPVNAGEDAGINFSAMGAVANHWLTVDVDYVMVEQRNLTR